MIVRKIDESHLLCIRQTTHAQLAWEFCRHWGNDDFEPPEPYSSVMLAISQHDNGWYEWEEHPRLCEDGYPMDFMHGPSAREKRVLWQRSVDRAYAQHPYAGILVARHAEHLYRDNLAHTPENERQESEAFLQGLNTLPDGVRRRWQHDDVYDVALRESTIEAHTHLLKFGDTTSLQVSIPWGESAEINHCPVNRTGESVDITMTVTEHVINFDPWPFGVDAFEVGVHGRLLNNTHFRSESAYHAALRHAPFFRLSWRVSRG